MRKIINILGLVIILCSCKNEVEILSSDFREVCLVTGDKVSKLDGSSSKDSSGIFIVYVDDYVIYKTPKIVYKDNTTTTIGDTIKTYFVNPDTTFKYYVGKKNQDISFVYDNPHSKNGKRFYLDSLLKDIGIHPSMLGVYGLKLGIPNETIQDNDQNKVEKYLNRKHIPEDPDSIYRYYNKKLIGIGFSFSPLLDKESNSKLIKTSFINIYKGAGIKENVIRSEFYSEMKEIKITSAKEYLLLIKQYDNDVKRSMFK